MPTPTGGRRRALSWASSGLVDLEFYSALRGRSFADDVEAAEDFVGAGMRDRLSTDPMLDFHSLPPDVRRAWRQGEVEQVLDHLGGSARHRGVGPLVAHPEPGQARERMLEIARLLGGPVAGRPVVLASPRQGEVATSVVLVATSLQPAARAVHRVREDSPADVEIVVVDHGTPPHAALGLHARLVRDRATTVRVPAGMDPDEALALGRSLARGELLSVMSEDVLVRPGWLAELAAVLDRGGAAGVVPLVLDTADLIAAGGELQGRPPEDIRLSASDELARSPHDLILLRARDMPVDDRDEPNRLVATARVTTLGPALTTLPAVREDARPPGSLRWSLRLPSPPGARGDVWGDTYFANALGRSLRRLGEDVVTRRRGAHEAGPTDLDDVNLALRGLHPIPAAPGAVNVLWVISHPEDVRLEELEGYDVVCAASIPWSRKLAERSGREVVPLLQASEFERPAVAVEPDEAMVFVGNADARRDRPMVRKVLEAGVPLAVYGRGWASLPAGVWRAEHVDNRLLPELYRKHRIVLADHWEDMAAEGFVANRLFDAVASGARVVSDPVVGLLEVFDADLVAVATTPDEIAAAHTKLRGVADDLRPRTSVSFDDRARALYDLVRSPR